MIAICIIAFFTKQELLWAIGAMLAGVLMVTSYDVERSTYDFNETTFAYQAVTKHNSYPYLMGINMLFFFIAVALGLFDAWDKYGSQLHSSGDRVRPPSSEV